LHLAVDAGTGEIVACVLTDSATDDAGRVPALLETIEGEIASVAADGAYDGEPVYRAIAGHQPDPPPDVVIPPRASAVSSTGNAEAQSQRDRHIRIIAEKGRMAWQKATGYGRRSLVETAVGRYKAIIGPKLRARILPAQQGEAAMAAEVLNRMIRVAKPISIRIA
jgi:transposase